MTQISFWVLGTPKAQPRPRAFARKMGNTFVARVYDAGTAEGWKGSIAMAAAPFRPPSPLLGPLRVDIDFYFPRPKYLMARKYPDGPMRHTSKPDRDNLDKAALDCLTTLGFWDDDSQACEGEPRKFYVAKGNQPGARIVITVLGEAVEQPAREVTLWQVPLVETFMETR